MRWRTVCFDLDNTLFSHEDAFEKAICYCFEKLQEQWLQENRIESPIDVAMWFKTFKKYSDLHWNQFETRKITAQTYRRLRYHDTMKEFQMPYSDKEADAFHAQYYDIVDSFSEPFEGLDELMNELKERNVKVGIITNGGVDTQYRKIEKIGLSSFINNDQIFVSDELGVAKPNREIFDLALRKLGVTNEKLFIGDSWEHDVCGAIDAGWDAIYLNTRKQPASTDHEPVATYTKLTQVLNLIKNDQTMKG
ncbi:HAD family hydrolase [Alkalihalobacterium elongatum]|uniref:HAD family hydrolase n=1 Tax=Alkalihalobacterium elongatum TaxID=2675466 RepID=UPI001C1F7D6E|nr:HAD family hydrolase [Alkalihalobacterium elongatum]